MKAERITHAFDPVFDFESRLLILGTMPSPKSRELGFYYSHPRNRFWPVLAKIFGEEIPKTPEEKRNFCLRNKIALWDVLKECDIEGASDSSIKNAVPNDLSVILNSAKIQAIFATGATAAKLYKKFIEPETKIPATALPSTSPANAKIKFEELVEEYKIVLEYIK
ncbi:MAG: DNA-deoxyinosine glycosylase [Oscillospiraceae bacterium]|nr:DNA-deoxyinosine glycosylase [Oscillospiraceae bacterium]